MNSTILSVLLFFNLIKNLPSPFEKSPVLRILDPIESHAPKASESVVHDIVVFTLLRGQYPKLGAVVI